MAFFPVLNQNFIAYRSSKLPSRPDCILKLTSCDSQALVGCIPIPAEAVHLNMYSNNIVNFQESSTISNAYTKYIYVNMYMCLYV